MRRALDFLVGGAVGALAAAVVFRLRADAPAPRPNVTPALDRVNDAFHESYDGVRATAEDEAPTFVLLGDTLVVCTRARQEEIPVTPTSFHALKSAAHAPVAAYAILHSDRGAELAPTTRRALERLRASLVEETEAGRPASPTAAQTLSKTRAFVEGALREGRATGEALQVFARGAGPLLTALTEEATVLQLAALDAATERALSALSPAGRRHLHVVVAGDHQARKRSLGMQYFEKRLADASDAETRITYGEGVTTVDEALSLVGKQRFDRELAVAFFGDAKKLQQDVLGAAAEALLARHPPRTF